MKANGYSVFLLKAIEAALKAGQVILEVYHSEFAVEHKADNSPLTRADQKSHELLIAALKGFDIPILSEEGREMPYKDRKTWERLWIIDPLDGTKEFIKRNDEFTVNIALVEYGLPKIGVVYVPVKDRLYFAAGNLGAFRIDNPLGSDGSNSFGGSDHDPDKTLRRLLKNATRLPAGNRSKKPFIIVGSRSHANPDLKKLVEEKRREHGEVELITAGSSLKICMVAEGLADMYPRLGPTCEWDTAAGQAVAEMAGAKLLDYKTGEPLKYNRPDLLNPWFVVRR
ncbi:MAG: 3'(2'),5'-bisphosphate nucleotidase CysQ [Desulfobacterales bacterium]|jgi:3'(2'), 5'-bisphosphate nucleotidase